MKHYDDTDITRTAVQTLGKWAVYVSCDLNVEIEEDEKIFDLVVSYANDHDCGAVISGGLFVFDSESEAQEFFNFFNTKPIYASNLYAALYSDSGECLDENT